MKNFRLASIAFFVWAMLASSVQADDSKPDSRLPAVDIVKGIVQSEESDPSAENPETGTIAWDPYIDPDFTRSWIYSQIPSQVLENLELNKDQDGNPLFPLRATKRQ